MEQLDFFNNLEQNKPICPICGNTFEKYKRKKYCSKSCINKKHYEKNRDILLKKKREYYKNNKQIHLPKCKSWKKCLVCGNSFENNNKQIYCSKLCRLKDWKIKNLEKIKESKRIYRIKNRERYREHARKFYHKNRDKLLLKNKQYHIDNKEKIQKRKKQTNKIYKQKNKEKIEKQRLEYRKKNRKRLCENQKEYYRKNKKFILGRERVYAKNNRDKINSYAKEKYNKDVSFKIAQNIRTRMRKALKTQKTLKRNKTVNLIGCSFHFLKTHIEKQFKEGMTWENHGNNGWHIDHIIPCASFDLTDPEQQKKCFHYTNLQPLWASENISKGAKIL